MLRNLKSIYFIRILFSLVNDKTKLRLIKYNKNFQNIIDINIINYKIMSGRYIIYDSSGKGKEYDSYEDSLLFEGKFLNGKRWEGKGKEINGDIILIGEYSEGKLNGKVKEYREYILIFEGEYIEGKRNGLGKEYYFFGNLIFNGIFKAGKKWEGIGYDKYGHKIYELKNGKGYIKEYDDFGILKYEGEYSNGERNGKGKEYDEKEQLVFEGEYFKGKKWNGKGYYDLSKNNKYEIKNGKYYVYGNSEGNDDILLLSEGGEKREMKIKIFILI